MLIFAQIVIMDNSSGLPVQYVYNGEFYNSNGPYVYLGTVVDDVAPGVTGVDVSNPTPSSTEDIEVSFELLAEGIGSSRIESVLVYYRVAGGTWIELTPVFYGGEYSVVIPAQSGGSTIEYYIQVVDAAGNTFTSSTYSVTVKPDDYGPYILIGIIGALFAVGLIVAIMQNKARVKKATGKERYKYIKKNVGGK